MRGSMSERVRSRSASDARSDGSGDEAHASAASGDSSRPWESLPQDCLSLIARYSTDTAARNMRHVCRDWATLTRPGDAATLVLRGRRCGSHAAAPGGHVTATAAAALLPQLVRSQPTLRSLYLEGAQVAEGSLHCLASLPRLRALALVACHIEVRSLFKCLHCHGRLDHSCASVCDAPCDDGPPYTYQRWLACREWHCSR